MILALTKLKHLDPLNTLFLKKLRNYQSFELVGGKNDKLTWFCFYTSIRLLNS